MEMGHQQLESLLADTVMLLCKNGLQFKSRLKIEGLIGITVDSTVFLVHLNEEIVDQSKNISDDRFNIGTSKNQLKPVEKTSNPVVTRNTASPKRNNSTSLAVQYPKFQAPKKKITVPVTPIEREQIDAKEANINDENSSNDCAVICETNIKSEITDTNGADNCFEDQMDDSPFQNSKGSFNVNLKHVIPLAVSAASFLKSNINDVRLDRSHEYNDKNYAPVSFSPGQIQSSSLSSIDRYKRSGTNALEMDDDGHSCSLTSIKAYSAKRRLGITNAQHVNSKRSDTFSSPPKSNGSNAFVLSQSVHICGYPQCGKQFQHKHHLLRHQTRKHGREPMRKRLNYGPYDNYYNSSSQQNSFVDNAEENYDNGEENYDSNGQMMTEVLSQRPADGLSSTLYLPDDDAGERKYSGERGGISPVIVGSSY